jgi:hypothetical protein
LLHSREIDPPRTAHENPLRTESAQHEGVRFRPRWFALGAGLSLVSVAALGFLGVRSRRG